MICGTAVCALKPLLGREAKRKITWLDLCVWVCVLEYVYRNKAAVGTFCSFAMKSSLLVSSKREENFTWWRTAVSVHTRQFSYEGSYSSSRRSKHSINGSIVCIRRMKRRKKKIEFVCLNRISSENLTWFNKRKVVWVLSPNNNKEMKSTCYASNEYPVLCILHSTRRNTTWLTRLGSFCVNINLRHWSCHHF